MYTLLQPLVSMVIGFALFVYGVFHVLTRYPGSAAFDALVTNLPAMSAVLLFALGLLAVVAGVALVVQGSRNLRRRWHRFNRLARHAAGPISGGAFDPEPDWDGEYR